MANEVQAMISNIGTGFRNAFKLFPKDFDLSQKKLKSKKEIKYKYRGENS